MESSPDDRLDPTRFRFQPNRIELEEESYLDEYKGKWFRSGDVAELYHENTKLGETTSKQMGRSISLFETPAMEYFQSRFSPDYPGAELIDLPTDVEIHGDISEALTGRRSHRGYSDRGLTLEQLSKILLYSCGHTHETPVESLGIATTKHFRAYPSGGALYPTEIYPLVFHSPDLDPGIYYYNVDHHGLRVLTGGEDSLRAEFEDVFLDPISEWNTSVVLFLTGAFWRSKMKYGPRGYRYTLQESGHIAQNVQLVCQVIHVGSVPLASFYDDRANDLLGVDGVNEAVVYALVLGNLESNP